MKGPILAALLVLVIAVSIADGGLINFIVRGIKIGARSIKGVVGAVTAGGKATLITTAILSTADLALNLGNVLSGGCMYEKEICSLTPEIEKLEAQMIPLFNQLTLLDQKNNKMYNDLTKAFEKQNELAQLAGKLEFLVLSIVQKLGEPAKLDQLAQEFEANTQNLMDTFKTEMKQYKDAMKTKAATSGIADISVLLYVGSKSAYASLKASGKISSPSHFKSVKFPSTGLGKLLPPKMFNQISSSLTSVKNFFKRPGVANFAGRVANGGMVLGSIAGLGMTLAVDISKAGQMKDSLRKTRDQLKENLKQVRIEIAREQDTEKHLVTAFDDLKKTYVKFANMINPSTRTQLDTKGGSTPTELYYLQIQAVAMFKRLNLELKLTDINFSVIQEIRQGVDFGDDVTRMISTIKTKGWGTFYKPQILNVIAVEYPNMDDYKGDSLIRYRPRG